MVRAIGWTSGNAIAGGYYSQVNFDYLTTLAYAALQPVSSTNPALVMRNGPWSHLSTIVADAHSRGKRAAFSIYDWNDLRPESYHPGAFNAFVNNGLLAQFAANVADKALEYGFDEVEIDHEDWTEPGPTFPMRKAVVDAIYAALNPIGVEVVYYSAALPIPGSFAAKIGWMEVNTNPSVRPPTEDSAFQDTVNATLQLYNLGWPKEKLATVIRTWADYMDPVINWPSTACAISDVFAAGLDLHPSSGNITEIDSVFWGPNWPVPGGKLYWDGIDLIKRKTDWMKANGFSTLTYFTSDNDAIPNNDPHSLIRNAWEGMSGAPPPPAFLSVGYVTLLTTAQGLATEPSLSYLTDVIGPAVIPASTSNPVMTGLHWNIATFCGYAVPACHAKGIRISPYLYTSVSNLQAIISGGKLSIMANSIRDMVVANNLDGISLDVEGGVDQVSMASLVDAVYALLNPLGKTVSISAQYGEFSGIGPDVSLATAQKLDFIMPMCYDMWWQPNGYPQATIVDSQAAMNMWANAGYPKDKLVMGIPFYGRTAYVDSLSPKQDSKYYSELLAAGNPATSVDAVTVGGRSYWYGGPDTDRAKVRWLIDNGYGGIGYFALDYDKLNDPKSLLLAVHNEIGGTTPPDEFPAGALKTASVTVKVIPGGVPMSAEVWLGPNPTTKVATSGKVPFTSTGNNQTVVCPVTMPATPGTYHVYMDLYQGSVLVETYVANQDVTVTGGTTYLYHVAVTITPAGAGSVTLTPGGTVSGAGGQIGFDANIQTVPTHVANAGHTFVAWVLDGTNHGDALYSFTAGDRNLQAVFS